MFSKLHAIAALAALTSLVPAVCVAKTHHPLPPSRRAASRLGRTALASRHSLPRGVFQMPVIRLSDGAMPLEVQNAPKAIVVSKAQKTLMLMENGAAVKTYPVAIGRTEAGPKGEAGDWRTPEGLYFVAGHNGASRFHLALRLSYPNAEDAARGVEDGLITEAQANAIRAAFAAGTLPPQTTALGGNVEIHGGYHVASTPTGDAPRIRSYTKGCVALTNPMVEEIYAWANNGTPVWITP